MKRIIILSVMLIGVFLISPVASQDGPWREFYTNSAGNKFYYDENNMLYRDPDLTAKADVKVSASGEGPGPRELTMVIEINCREVTYRKLEWEVPGPDGSVRTVKNQNLSEWYRIPELSYLDILNGIICKSFKGVRHNR
jgi:hypothetical protein